jgi:hypothetical protein
LARRKSGLNSFENALLASIVSTYKKTQILKEKKGMLMSVLVRRPKVRNARGVTILEATTTSTCPRRAANMALAHPYHFTGRLQA